MDAVNIQTPAHRDAEADDVLDLSMRSCPASIRNDAKNLGDQSKEEAHLSPVTSEASHQVQSNSSRSEWSKVPDDDTDSKPSLGNIPSTSSHESTSTNRTIYSNLSGSMEEDGEDTECTGDPMFEVKYSEDGDNEDPSSEFPNLPSHTSQPCVEGDLVIPLEMRELPNSSQDESTSPSPETEHDDSEAYSTPISGKETFSSQTLPAAQNASKMSLGTRPCSTMLPILTVPKIKLRQNKGGLKPSWSFLSDDSSTSNAGESGDYRAEGSFGQPHLFDKFYMHTGNDASRFNNIMGGATSEDSSSTDPRISSMSILQMALQHGSSQLTSQENHKSGVFSQSAEQASVRVCPILPINPKKLGDVKHRNMTAREKRYYQCEHCDIIYQQPRKLERHLKDMRGKAPYQCCYCELKFPTIGCRRFHSQMHEDKTLHCPYCPKVFHEKRRYEDHVRSHTGEAPFMCQECGNVYRTRSALRIHKRTHGNDKPLQCRFCPKRFIRIGDVQVHERTHTGEKPYKCGICTRSFATSSQVNRHRRTHSEERPHECSYCKKTFKNPDYLITHEKMHLGHKPHHCQYCPKQFRTPRELVHHERVHTGEKPYECKVCGHRFSKKTNLKQHELQHTGLKSFKCSECPKSFYRKASLVWHEKIHENRDRFLCKECGKLFFKESSRDKHCEKAHGGGTRVEGTADGEGTMNGDMNAEPGEENHTDHDANEEVGEFDHPEECSAGTGAVNKMTPTKRIPQRSVNDGTDSTCEECGKTFLARRSLLRHYRNIHHKYISRNVDEDSTKPKKAFPCRFCEERFQSDHLRHVHEATHTNEIYSCDTCNKTFSTRNLLYKHEKIHSKVKPFVCEICGSAFTIKWYLNRHINIVHSDAYTFTCNICSKKFKSKTAVTVHMELHNVEGKVYKCDHCDAVFHVKRYLARHKRKHHSGNTDNLQQSADKDEEDHDPLYDFDDMEDEYPTVGSDSSSVSGVFLRQMLCKGADYKKLAQSPPQQFMDPLPVINERHPTPDTSDKEMNDMNIQEDEEEEEDGDQSSDKEHKETDETTRRDMYSEEDKTLDGEEYGHSGLSGTSSAILEKVDRDMLVLGLDDTTGEETEENYFDEEEDDMNDEDYVEDNSMSDFDDL